MLSRIRSGLRRNESGALDQAITRRAQAAISRAMNSGCSAIARMARLRHLHDRQSIAERRLVFHRIVRMRQRIADSAACRGQAPGPPRNPRCAASGRPRGAAPRARPDASSSASPKHRCRARKMRSARRPGAHRRRAAPDWRCCESPRALLFGGLGACPTSCGYEHDAADEIRTYGGEQPRHAIAQRMADP